MPLRPQKIRIPYHVLMNRPTTYQELVILSSRYWQVEITQQTDQNILFYKEGAIPVQSNDFRVMQCVGNIRKICLDNTQ